MSLVTRCTACGTLFKVVADQLKISEGWVRCGQCSTVFDAQAHLVPEQETEVEPEQMTASAQAQVQPSPADSASFLPGQLRALEELDQDAGPSTATWASTRDSQITSVLPSDAALLRDDFELEKDGGASASQPSQATPSFVAQAQRAARWRSPSVRLALAMGVMLLLAVFVLQIALHERDRIAATHSSTKPWLTLLCNYAGCQVKPLKRLESITVDASSFNRLSKGNAPVEPTAQSYRLGVTLKNSGLLPVAVPHVELSLQDAQDQLLLRRVLSPAELGLSIESLSPAQDIAGQVTLQVDTLQLAGSRVQGYRILAFYP
jgi:predicted Zn finger-like uncharacterized protein